MRIKTICIAFIAAAILLGCSSREKVLHVYLVTDPSEETVLLTPCGDFSDKELKSKEFKTLCKDMIATVTDPSQDGVGIAGPQVGVSKRIIVVCRLDKEGEPFIAYPNAQIDSTFGGIVEGREGCLSIPGYYGDVPRSEGIVVSYTDPKTLKRVTETVTDYTARIFQHEIDHTNGILYTDRTPKVYPDTLAHDYQP